MRIVCVVSMYPVLTETFVARELEQLVKAGHEIIICPLRPPASSAGPSGLLVQGAQVLRSRLNLWDFVSAQVWLLRRDFATWIACWADVFDDVSKLSRIHHLTYILMLTTWIAKKFKNAGIDHIRGHFLHSEALSAMWLSRMLGVPYSLTAHTVSFFYPYKFITKIVQESLFLIGDTSEAYNFLSRIRRRGLYLIHNGINLDEFRFTEPQYPTSGLPIILGIGSLIEKKGFDVLIQAGSILHRKGVSFICRIIGDGKERPRLENMIQELGLEQIFQMPGSLPFNKLIEEYKAARIFVMASKDTSQASDGLPTVIVESMALGVPVVATRKAGIPELVIDNITGLLVEPGDPYALADAMERLLKDDDLRKQLSLAARNIIEKEYDIKKSGAQLMELIESYV
jgi:glycosyltransferase involved in cell wall biosynthesis